MPPLMPLSSLLFSFAFDGFSLIIFDILRH